MLCLKRINWWIAVLIYISLTSHAFAHEVKKAQSKNPGAQELIDQAWVLVTEKVTYDTLDRSIELLEKAATLDPQNPEIRIELADEYWFRSEMLPKDTEEQQEVRIPYLEKGLAHAEKALELRENTAAHFWTAVHHASLYEFRSIFAQAAIFPSLIKHMDYGVQDDRFYLYGAWARFMSGMVSRIPEIVLKMVGYSYDDIQYVLDEAINHDPGYIMSHVFLAEFQYKTGKPEQALKTLDNALTMDPQMLPEMRSTNCWSQERARYFYKKWSGKEHQGQAAEACKIP